MEFFEFDESFIGPNQQQSAVLDVAGWTAGGEMGKCKGYLSRSGNPNLPNEGYGGANGYIGQSAGCANASVQKIRNQKMENSLKLDRNIKATQFNSKAF